MPVITGGSNVKKFLSDLAKNIKSAKNLRVGFLENATYPDGTQVGMVAAIQEFGAPRKSIPPRPFFRNMIAKNGKDWPKRFLTFLKATNYNAKTSLEYLGMDIAGDLKQSIIDTNDRLSPITLMLRKMKKEDPNLIVTGKTVGEAAARVRAGESVSGISTKPLVETAHMLNSIDYEVK